MKNLNVVVKFLYKKCIENRIFLFSRGPKKPRGVLKNPKSKNQCSQFSQNILI